MSEAQEFTAQQAADPQTPGQVLADIAALRPDLRPAVAANPSAYPSLLEWLGGLGEPAVDAALRARESAPADGQPTAVLPTAPPYGAPQPFGAPTAGYGAPTAGYGAPNAGYGAAPSGGPGYAGAPAQPQPYGYQPTGAPVRKSSNKVLWIVLGVIGFVLVLGIVAVIVIRGLIENALPSGDFGSDPDLDILVTQCENEDWAACDQLYNESPGGSEYEQFGDTCGNRTDGGTYCVEEFGDASEPSTYGDDPELDALWDACAGGDGQACDDLYNASPIGSDYESFGDTCGQTTDGSAPCAAGGEASANAYGDDPALDALWDACAAGDATACDDLFKQAPSGSEYEDFGNTCGGTADGSTWCAAGADPGAAEANTYGDDPALDALWDACAAGDAQACDDLYNQAPVGSEYEDFGDTCAGTTDGTEWCVP